MPDSVINIKTFQGFVNMVIFTEYREWFDSVGLNTVLCLVVAGPVCHPHLISHLTGKIESFFTFILRLH